jgi:Ca2+-binding EF-hand superfamily protein
MIKQIASIALLAVAAPLLAQQQGRQPPSPAEGFMMQFDANQDGEVSLQEFKDPQMEALEQQFDYMDKNDSGTVDSAEIDAFSQEMQQRMQQMQQQRSQQR